MNNKFILDACCGGRMFWYNKYHPNVLYVDNNPREKGHIKVRKNHNCNPNKIMDFRKLDLENNSFKLVVFDPPHLILGEKAYMKSYYGGLNKDTWRDDLTKGFNECWRVLEDYGILIFKWNEAQISRKEVLSLFKKEPLFGHPIQSKTKTHWFCFMKLPGVTT